MVRDEDGQEIGERIHVVFMTHNDKATTMKTTQNQRRQMGRRASELGKVREGCSGLGEAAVGPERGMCEEMSQAASSEGACQGVPCGLGAAARLEAR